MLIHQSVFCDQARCACLHLTIRYPPARIENLVPNIGFTWVWRQVPHARLSTCFAFTSLQQGRHQRLSHTTGSRIARRGMQAMPPGVTCASGTNSVNKLAEYSRLSRQRCSEPILEIKQEDRQGRHVGRSVYARHFLDEDVPFAKFTSHHSPELLFFRTSPSLSQRTRIPASQRQIA
jgi:hypothetical protein